MTTLFTMATPTSHPKKLTSLSQLHFLHNLHVIRYFIDLFMQFILSSLGSLTPHQGFSFLRARAVDRQCPEQCLAWRRQTPFVLWWF